MAKKYFKKPENLQIIARERINILFHQAKAMFKKDPKLSDRYVHLARKIAMKYKVKIPVQLKRQFCKECHKYLVPGSNLRIRSHKGRTIYYCLQCKKFMRFSNKPKKA